MLIPLTDEILIMHTEAGGKLVTPREEIRNFVDAIEKIDDVRKRFGKLYLDPAGVVWSRVCSDVYQRINGYWLR